MIVLGFANHAAQSA